MQRWVLHIDMDAFFASVEQLTRPTLRGRPVLVGGMSGRGVVAGASYEARERGARSAMPMFRAQQLVGMRGVVVRPRSTVYVAASQRVFGILEQAVDVVEKVSIDEAFLEPPELYGAQPAAVEQWCAQLRADIRQHTGLAASIGAGSGKQFAKIGSGLAKPDGMCIIPAATQLEILHPLPVDKLWGVGPVTAAKLRAVGIDSIGDLAAMSRKEVEITLGSTVGVALWHMAQGIDERPVAPRAVAKQISQEHTYAQDLHTRESVDAAIDRAARGAHRRLLRDGRGARTVTLKLRMADFHIESRSQTLAYATDSLDTLLATALNLARYPDELGPIRLVGVSYSGLETAQQDVLFPELDAVVRTPDRTADSWEYEPGVAAVPGTRSGAGAANTGQGVEPVSGQRVWEPTQDIVHSEFGHGWVQGTGHGVVSVRFETRSTGPGPTRSFAVDDPDLRHGDPLDSLDWPDWIASEFIPPQR
ncbi:DNA polymerase IV [Corynebacterium lizhenjunii]|uniref:DNA polymerase IV n=1 Tax=Corynebacterium lizhenjunii TaxID=2709394 RepID=A0A7T0P982_9CORY|nr:DNA polymerase IV [Corynebacterium lizhenjunii]QPK78493.1 DNA polymerase IV [Corynebacterium lizhenjunii]